MRGVRADARHPEDPEGVHSATLRLQARKSGQLSARVLPKVGEGK